MNDEDHENNVLNGYENQLKEIIQLNLLNKNSVNETLEKTFKIILSIINNVNDD